VQAREMAGRRRTEPRELSPQSGCSECPDRGSGARMGNLQSPIGCHRSAERSAEAHAASRRRCRRKPTPWTRLGGGTTKMKTRGDRRCARSPERRLELLKCPLRGARWPNPGGLHSQSRQVNAARRPSANRVNDVRGAAVGLSGRQAESTCACTLIGVVHVNGHVPAAPAVNR
jgi:hypothetical protein